MNMHGIIRSVRDPIAPTRSALVYERGIGVLRAWRNFILFVLLPTALTAAYLYLLAADQYESRADFAVSQGGAAAASPGGFGELVGLGVTSPSESAARRVVDFLMSHDAVAQAEPQVDLNAMFHRPEIDLANRLRDANPSPERLLRYYRQRVATTFDRDTGVVTLKVRLFRPDDAFRLSRTLLQLGERRVNEMNEPGYIDAIRVASRQFAEADRAAADIQRSITGFRQSRGDIDPQSTGEAQLKLVADLKSRLTLARAKLAAMSGVIDQSSPQTVALQREARSIAAALNTQSGELAGDPSAIAKNLGNYEDLRSRQEFAVKRYDAAAAALEKARSEFRRQQLYIVRVVNPNRPVESLFPQRGRIVLTTFIVLGLIYCMGWLIAAGVREHKA